MDRYRMAMPPPVTGWAQTGYFRRQNSPAPSRARPAASPSTTRPVSPIHSLSKASLRKKPMPIMTARMPMRASQFPTINHSQLHEAGPEA